MSNLAERWTTKTLRKKLLAFPVSVRLRPEVDLMLQEVMSEFPHLNQSQVINDCLQESLSRVFDSLNS